MQSSAGTALARGGARAADLARRVGAGRRASSARRGSASSIGEPNVIYLDIGGTTAKCSLIEDGEPRTTTEYRIEWRPTCAGYPVMVPVVDIVEIGAGGGSIAWIDDGGALRRRPAERGRRSRARPCYGRGGTEPTVTDAKLARRRARPRLLPRRAAAASTRSSRARRCGRSATPLGTATAELANGVIRLVEREHDQRAQARLGAARLRPARLRARRLRRRRRDARGGARRRARGASRSSSRPLSGVFSAWGMLHDRAARSTSSGRASCAASRRPAPQLDALFAELEREAAAALRRARARQRRRGSTTSARSTCATAARSTPCACRSRGGPISAAALEADFHAAAPPQVHVRPRGRHADRARHVPRLGARPRAARGRRSPRRQRRRRHARRRSAARRRRLRRRRHARDRRLRAGRPPDRLRGRRARS